MHQLIRCCSSAYTSSVIDCLCSKYINIVVKCNISLYKLLKQEEMQAPVWSVKSALILLLFFTIALHESGM